MLGPPGWLCLLLVQRLCPSQSLLALVPLICIPENGAAHWLRVELGDAVPSCTH